MNDKELTAKQWLERGRNLRIELKSIKELKAAYIEKITKCTAPTDKERISGSKKENYAKEKYIELSIKLDKKEIELENILDEIETAIESVPDSVCRTILRERYLKHKAWWQIANIVHYHEKYVIQDLHPRALGYVEEIKGRDKCLS